MSSDDQPRLSRCICCDRAFEAANDSDDLCQQCQSDEWLMIDDVGGWDDEED